MCSSTGCCRPSVRFWWPHRRRGSGADTGPGQRSIICNCPGTSASPSLPLTAITARIQVWCYLASVLAWQRFQSTIETKRIQETQVCLATKHLPVVIIVLRQSSHQRNTSTPSPDHYSMRWRENGLLQASAHDVDFLNITSPKSMMDAISICHVLHIKYFRYMTRYLVDVIENHNISLKSRNLLRKWIESREFPVLQHLSFKCENSSKQVLAWSGQVSELRADWGSRGLRWGGHFLPSSLPLAWRDSLHQEDNRQISAH